MLSLEIVLNVIYYIVRRNSRLLEAKNHYNLRAINLDN